MESNRSFHPIDLGDLERLAGIARQDRLDFFARNPRWAKLYERRFLCSALCQGSALHYIDHKTGVKDFDIWHFFAESPVARLYPKRRAIADFGIPKFGVTPDHPKFIGRRVDLMMRSIPVIDGHADSVRAYLRSGRTKSARLLSQKAAVGLEPGELLGVVVWPVKRTSAGGIEFQEGAQGFVLDRRGR